MDRDATGSLGIAGAADRLVRVAARKPLPGAVAPHGGAGLIACRVPFALSFHGPHYRGNRDVQLFGNLGLSLALGYQLPQPSQRFAIERPWPSAALAPFAQLLAGILFRSRFAVLTRYRLDVGTHCRGQLRFHSRLRLKDARIHEKSQYLLGRFDNIYYVS